MMFDAPALRVVLATVHIPLADVPRRSPPTLMARTIALAAPRAAALRLPTPRLAVAGLNPHAGEHGLMGREDDDGHRAGDRRGARRRHRRRWPLPADTVFLRASRGEFDAVVACYHDQGLIPVKLLAFGQAVNVTLGLPIVRTSVDHGTAFDIAGRGVGRRRSAWSRPSCSRPAWRRGPMPELTEREKAQRIVAENRKALHDYHILETFEAGVVLQGTEVKSIREGRVNLRDSYARVEAGEIFVYNIHISAYSNRGYADHEPTRRRKLLLHRQEIRKLIGKTVERGMTLVPLRLYFKGGKIKLAISLAQGKQAHDKRAAIRKREVDRETRAAVKQRSR